MATPAAHVQNLGDVTTSDVGATSTVLSPVSKTVTAGNTLILGVSFYYDITATSVTDNLGNTYSRSERVVITAVTSDLWYAPITTGGSITTITVNHPSTRYVDVIAAEFSGVGTFSGVGGGTGSQASGGVATWATSKTIPAYGLAVGFTGDNSTANTEGAGSASGSPSTTIVESTDGSTQIYGGLWYAIAGASDVTTFTGTATVVGASIWRSGSGGIFNPAATPAHVSRYAALVLADDPIAYWRLGEASGMLIDATGNGHNTTSINGVLTYSQPGAIVDADTSISFPAGASGWGVVPHHAAFNIGNGPLSVEAWVKRATTGVAGRWFGKYADGPSGWGVGSNGTGDVVAWYPSNYWIISSETPLNNTNWHHVVVTKNGSARTVYCDGVALTNTSGDPTFVDTTNDLGIGAPGNSSSNKWDGLIDEVAVYGAVLTPTQIQAHYNAGKGKFGPASPYAALVLADSPTAYWRLGEPSGTTINDEVGTADGTYVNTPTLGATGLLVGDADKATTFAAASAEHVSVSTGIPAGSTKGVSLEAWVNFASLPASSALMTFIRRGPESNTIGFAWFQVYNASGTYALQLEYTDGIAYRNSWVNWSPAPSTGTTYHIAIVLDYATKIVTAYVNGASIGTWNGTAYGTPATIPANAATFIAGYSAALHLLDGTLDEPAVYDDVLSPAQVLAHYNAGKGKYGPASPYATLVLADSPVVYLRLGEASGTAADNLGSGGATLDGTYVNTPTLGVTGLLTGDSDTSVSFNGTDERVSFASGTGLPTGSAARAVEYWFLTSDGAGTYKPIYGYGSAATDQTFKVGYDNGGGGGGRIFVSTGGTDKFYGTGYCNGVRHHVVAVLESATSIRVWVDGSDLGAQTFPTLNTVILASDGGIAYFGGGYSGAATVDEVAVYNTVLSSTQISAHYAAGKGKYGALRIGGGL